ncbi:hypothetical protein TNCT_585851 [Trichonephila clavata]|uniref:Uncharacterized protein n=1 Tax=Trichonephila clavata TaxID=2740835 RepID=A0A8X6KRM1_TRICU|nr:hypothetical protein TNCT_585851 [Trichonephila clavata]
MVGSKVLSLRNIFNEVATYKYLKYLHGSPNMDPQLPEFQRTNLVLRKRAPLHSFYLPSFAVNIAYSDKRSSPGIRQTHVCPLDNPIKNIWDELERQIPPSTNCP